MGATETAWWRPAGVLVAAGLGGLCFAPVFGLGPLAGPVLAVWLACLLVLAAVRHRPVLAAWRPLLVLAGGLLAIVETMLFPTTVAGVPTPATVRALADGLRSWRRTLESTWPARPDPELALFVPLLVLLACLLAFELLDRAGGLTAMLPGLGVLLVSQAYEPLSGPPAYLVALGYAAAAALALAPTAGRPERAGSAPAGQRPARRHEPREGETDRNGPRQYGPPRRDEPRRDEPPRDERLRGDERRRDGPRQYGPPRRDGPRQYGPPRRDGPRQYGRRRDEFRRKWPSRRTGRDRGWLVGAAALAVAGLAGGLLVVGLDPAGRPPYTLQHVQAQRPVPRITSPLDAVAGRLAEPGTVAFRYRAEGPVGRWRLVVLDEFDGTNWTTERPFLRFGAELTPADAVSVPTTRQRGRVDLRSLHPPWLPSQSLPRTVAGAGQVLVEPDGGTLIAPDHPDRYTLTWAERQVSAGDLLGAAVDGDVPVGDLGRVPGRLAELASAAVSGKRATFQTALALERYLGERYELAGAAAEPGELPTGHGWPQLRRFLLEDRRGTSEQFAAAYVVLARLNGIPARLVVGFRAPAAADADGWTTVRNRDVLVWPEVAVDGIGWWPLDPAGLADPARPVTAERDPVTEQARAELPPPDQIRDPAVPDEDEEPEPVADPDGGGAPAGSRAWRWWLLLLPPVGWLAGVPLARWLRARARRRRSGSAAVAGAWAEARDRLRAHGVTVSSGMTVRDLAAAAMPIVGASHPPDGTSGHQAPVGLERLARAVDEALWSSAPATDQMVDQAWAGVREVVSMLRARPWPARLRAALDIGSLRPPGDPK